MPGNGPDGTTRYDFIIAGAGMAGASAAYFLSQTARVALLERESQPGYHTTGRSAALFSETYGPAVIRALTRASRAFFEEPPEGFSSHDLLSPRGAMFIARDDQGESLEAMWTEIGSADGIQRLRPDEAMTRVPRLRAGYVAGAILEAGARDIDVDGLHQGFLRGARARGAQIVTDAGIASLHREAGLWRMGTPAGDIEGKVLINAAGAWGDEFARLAGAKPVGLVPKRRTALLVDPPEGAEIDGWPITVDVEEQFYFKPDAGKLLISPADETPSEPCDAQPEELDVAIAVDRVQSALDIEIRRIDHKWAGLRSFVADKGPVAGYDETIEDFFWLVGQGGYGIQTAPGLGRAAATLALRERLPEELARQGVSAERLSGGRLEGRRA